MNHVLTDVFLLSAPSSYLGGLYASGFVIKYVNAFLISYAHCMTRI
jgi:hypothetical protein